ncbi:DUF1214 domain-containing protein [Sebaldella termitidis]|uniref:DUF1214 domain-containing protein n=1 Tax=Sebaldella termitidis TaxID=826 RepID=UPI003EB7EF8C
MRADNFIKKTEIIKKNIFKIWISGILFLLTFPSFSAVQPTEKEVTDSYLYLLGRYLVIRQENQDVNIEKNNYNKIKYNTPGLTEFANPNLDVVYLESWIAVDKNNGVILNVPEIKDRYYTVQLLDGWGEVVANINERTYPKHPYGKFAIVLKESNPKNIPKDALKVEVPFNKVKMLARVELKGTPDEAVRLQKIFTLEAPAGIKIEPVVNIPDFSNSKLIRADIFLKVDEVLKSYPDSMPKAPEYQKTVKKVADYMKSSDEAKKYIENIIQTKTIPEFMKKTTSYGVEKDGWVATYGAGNFGDDIVLRDSINFGGIWANTTNEAIYFGGTKDAGSNQLLNGNNTYKIVFSKDELPDLMADAFWSITLYNTPDYHVAKNALNKYNVNNMTKLNKNKDGSLTIWVGPELPKGASRENWIPTEKGREFVLTFRLYVPKEVVRNGSWTPPAIQKIK